MARELRNYSIMFYFKADCKLLVNVYKIAADIVPRTFLEWVRGDTANMLREQGMPVTDWFMLIAVFVEFRAPLLHVRLNSFRQ